MWSAVIELLENRVELFFTSYETEQEVKNHSYNSNDIIKVIYIGNYDGNNFEYNDHQIIDDDMIYKIARK